MKQRLTVVVLIATIRHDLLRRRSVSARRIGCIGALVLVVSGVPRKTENYKAIIDSQTIFIFGGTSRWQSAGNDRGRQAGCDYVIGMLGQTPHRSCVAYRRCLIRCDDQLYVQYRNDSAVGAGEFVHCRRYGADPRGS